MVILFASLRHWIPPSEEFGRLPGGGKAGLCGANPFYCPSGMVFRLSAELGTPSRRGAKGACSGLRPPI